MDLSSDFSYVERRVAGDYGGFSFETENTGAHSGQSDWRLRAYTPEDKLAGYLDYSTFEGRLHIQMIRSYLPKSRVGEYMMDELVKEHGYEDIDWGMMTAAGAGLRERLDRKYGIERVTEVVDTDELVASFGGRVLSEEPRGGGMKNVYVEFDNVKKAHEFANKVESMGAEYVNVQELGDQGWVEFNIVTHRHLVRKKL